MVPTSQESTSSASQSRSRSTSELIVRLAAAYEEPGLRVSTRGQVLTVGDYLCAYVVEWTLHHLDLIAHLPDAPPPPAEGLARSRETLERLAGAAFPASFSDSAALLVGTGRRAPTDAEKAELGELAAKIPFVLG